MNLTINKWNKYYSVFLLIIFIFTLTKPVTSINPTLTLSQNSLHIEVLEVSNDIALINNSSDLWNEIIKVKLLENYTASKTINIIFQEIINIEAVHINGTPSPNRVIYNNERSEITITPIIEIKENDILFIELQGTFVADLEQIEDERWLFSYRWGNNYYIPKMSLSIVLPEFSILSGNENLLDVFPSGYNFSSNGKNIIITWDNLVRSEPSETNTIIIKMEYYLDLNQSELNSSTAFNTVNFLQGMISILLIIILLIVLLIQFSKLSIKQFTNNVKYIFKNSQGEENVSATKIKTTIIPVILKPQLKDILLLIQENGGMMNQNDLVLQSGFSKSRISLYLKELDELELISKEKQGREKLVYLKVDIKT
ncbi:MAG: hypothetical protein GPJ54_08695 [Candidatus Heimdallarchaeota archaeon]|nr:hypothetical protein [Candidatus Heimdallarchaeota archaeon]